jgi:hypothetical protein
LRNKADIIQENKRRIGVNNSPYNPITGLGSPIKRTLVSLPDFNVSVYIPDTMLEVGWIKELVRIGSFGMYARLHPIPSDDPVTDLFFSFIVERYKHDFEYWAATTYVIQNKESLEETPFKLRKAQLKLLVEMEDMRVKGIPIRIILLKARQWGGSTLVQAYMFWIQQIHKQNWHMAVCAQGDDPAKNINAMYSRAAERYPKEVGSITLKAYERSPKNRVCVETGGIIGVGSYINPDQFRSYNYPMAHLSEVGLWEDTLKRKAANVAQSLRNTVGYYPYTVVVMESTAKGLGNFFHNEWIAAIERTSRYRPVFVAWWEIDMYQAEIMDYEKFIDEMTDYNWSQWNLGATLEGINWYILYKAGENLTDWQMQEEFPGTADEAFVSSGHKVFAPAYIQSLEKTCCKPEFMGEVFGDTRIGVKSLKNLRFQSSVNGNLWLWGMPDGLPIINRYGAFADIGGRTARADKSVLRIIDRLPMIEGGDPEMILTWRGNIDQDIFAWKAVQICMLFSIPEIGSYPLLAIESNSLKKEKGEGDHFYTVLDSIAEYYPNLYVRNDFEKIGDGFVPKYGFQTNNKSKGMIIDALNAASREVFLSTSGEQESWGYVEHDQRAVNECLWYEIKRDGSMGAVDGKNDDLVITTAGCVWLSNSHMDKPFVKEAPVMVSRKRVRRESDF